MSRPFVPEAALSMSVDYSGGTYTQRKKERKKAGITRSGVKGATVHQGRIVSKVWPRGKVLSWKAGGRGMEPASVRLFH